MSLVSRQPDLTDGVVRLRSWALDDLDCVRQAAADRRITEATTVPVRFTEEAGHAFVRRQWSRATDRAGISLVVTEADTDLAVGSVTLLFRPQRGVADLGYWLIPAARGRGMASPAARLLTEWALGTAGLARVEAWVEPDNLASRRVLAAAGFVEEGVLRSFLAFPRRRADAVVLARVAESEQRSSMRDQ
ncbi:GNAT family N-acetyltransferase [Micromonospora sp. NPDC005252]|uniref:GNAT family N-acetyltransferase n=1 Tax=Micromonospora sp. NPDC005252 TaxID=3364228 RepID=UPI0036A10196